MKNRVLALTAAALAFGRHEAVVLRPDPPKFDLDIKAPAAMGDRDSPPQRSKRRVAMDKRAARKKRRKS